MVGGAGRGAGLLAVAICAALLVPAGSPTAAAVCDPAERLDCLPPDLSTDLQWATSLERKIADNTWDGQVYEIDYATPERIPGQVESVGAFADSALWTGTYLGSQSFRYALAKKYLAEIALPGGQRNFWNDQRREAEARIRDMVRKFHILINISRYWNHELELSAEQAGFGGGIVNGEPGYLMRSCIADRLIENAAAGDDNGAPDWRGWSKEEFATDQPAPYTAKRRVFGPFRWQEGRVDETYYCEDGTSRDAYAGTIFGLLLAFDLFDDANVREQIRDDIVTLSNFALKYVWTTPRPHGRISIPFGSNYQASPCTEINAVIPICGHDFENFWSPLFIITPTAQMEMAQAAYHVVTTPILGKPPHRDTLKWQAVWHAELATTGPFLAISELFDSAQPYDSYFKWNLEHLIMYNLVRHAPNAVAQTLYKQAAGVMDATTGDDVNAHFEAITWSMTNEKPRLRAAIQHLREWREYRTRIEAGGVVDNSVRCKDAVVEPTDPQEDIECVPEDAVEMRAAPGAPQLPLFPGTESKLRARFPLEVERRTPTDFLWQRPPNQLVGGENNRHQAPGIDYLLPYWMIRYHTEGPPPVPGSFPLWPGPSFH